MIKKIEDLNYYELLEVSPTASSQEIHRAYERARKVYEPNSIALYSLFSSEETALIHQRIEEAYRTLMYESHRKRYDEMLRGLNAPHDPSLPVIPVEPSFAHRVPVPPAPHSPQERSPEQPEPSAEPAARELPPPPPFSGEFTGAALKLLREQRTMTLRQISDTIKVSLHYLELIEKESFEKLPARAYVRGFLTLYAKGLGYDPGRVTADYLKRYDAVMNPPKK
jgi:flagellar biosynthesis protein FlhG